VTKTHSRPHVSNDNPFSEAQFKALKYRPAFPERFGSIQEARAHCHVFFPWYNTEHHHAGLGLLAPFDVHHGRAEQRVAARAAVLATAYGVHPERCPGGLPQPPALPVEVWINPPKLPGRSRASSRIQPSDLPTRAPSRSLPSIAAPS
jgi:putative transposase